MNLQYLRVFLTVAEHEHITRASEKLILSQPAVTKTIQNLEHEVKLELIERHGRRIVLTHAGRVLYGYARKLFALEREMEDAMEALQDIESGEVNLAANTTTGVYLLPPIVARFRTLYPKVALHIAILNSQEIVDQTLNWNLDFGLVESDPSHLPSELEVEIFGHDQLVLVVSARHRWSKMESLRPEALCENELLLREQGSGIREVIENALLHHGVRVAPLLTVPDNEVIKRMVMSGVGAGILSALAVKRELATGDLVRVPLKGIDLHPQLSLVQRKDKQLSRAAQAFCALLQPIIEEEQANQASLIEAGKSSFAQDTI